MLKKKLNINNVMRTVMILVFIVSVTRGVIALIGKSSDPLSYFVSAITALGMFLISCIPSFLNQKGILAIRNTLNPISVVLFAFCFSLACELIWEIFEFSADSLIGSNMQRWQSDFTIDEWLVIQNVSNWSNPGLIDTMKDIINNLIGATVSSVFVYFSTVRGNQYIKSSLTTTDIVNEWGERSPMRSNARQKRPKG